MSGLDVQRILSATSVRTVDYHDELTSTNDLALQLVSGQPLPLLVVAERQTGGRGRGGNKWWAAEGALTYSLVIDAAALRLEQRSWPRVSLTVALAISDTLDELLPNRAVQLKWPNDVYLQGRKVCGILVETAPRFPGVLVLGIGVNVNNSLAAAPAELQATATSLSDVAQQTFDRTEVLIGHLRRIDERLTSLADAADSLPEVWRRRCLLEGRTLTIEAGHRRVTGICQGIDAEGALLLQTDVGVERCLAGVVARIL